MTLRESFLNGWAEFHNMEEKFAGVERRKKRKKRKRRNREILWHAKQKQYQPDVKAMRRERERPAHVLNSQVKWNICQIDEGLFWH